MSSRRAALLFGSPAAALGEEDSLGIERGFAGLGLHAVVGAVRVEHARVRGVRQVTAQDVVADRRHQVRFLDRGQCLHATV